MPTFNNPAYAQAFSNLSEMFKPPSASEVYAFERARAEKAKEQRLAELYAGARSPGFDRDTFDRQAAVAGLYAPTQGFGARDMEDATKRYGVDVGARTSLTNNEADNARALQTNQADNARALEAARLEQAGAGQRNILDNQTRAILGLRGPLNQGQVVPALEPDLASILGLPAMPSVAGAPKPLTETEVKGRAFAALPDQQQAAAVFGATPITTVQNEDGTTSRITTYQGLTDDRPTASKPADTNDVRNYVADGGKRRGLAMMGPNGVMIDAQTKAVLPPDATIFAGQAQGAPSEFGPKTTEAQDRAAYAAVLSEPAVNDLLSAYDKGKLPTATDYQIQQLRQIAPDAAAPFIVRNMSPEGQLFYANLNTVLPFQLLIQSGQAVSEPEAKRKLAELVPIPGESELVTGQKRRQLEAYIKAARGIAGPAYDKIHAPENVGRGSPTAPASPTAAAPTRITLDGRNYQRDAAGNWHEAP